MSLHQIYYREDQLPKLYPFATPYFNERLTIFFENAPIEHVVRQATTKNIGVCSWKLSDKMKIRVGIRRPLTEEAIDGDFEVLSLTRNSSRHQMMAMANAWHPGFVHAIDLLWHRLGFKRPPEAKIPIYQNHWIGKTEIYQRYVNEFLSPAMKLIIEDAELNKVMIQPSGYGTLSRKADMTNVKLQLGMDDYPLCPFVLERCPALWFQMRKVNITHL